VFLALREIRRAKVRFGLLVSAIALLVFLILIQVTLQNGLLDSFVGAIRAQSAPVLVYNVDGRRNLQGSVITPELEQQIVGADGVGASGRLGQGTFTVTAGGEEADAAVIGYEDPELGAPSDLDAGRLPDGPDEAVAGGAEAGTGFDVGDTITVEPGGLEIEVVGTAAGASLQATPTLFTTYETWEAAVAAGNPDAGTPLPNVIALAPADGVNDDELVAAVADAATDADPLTRQQAADDTPGVATVRQSFQVIFLLYALVVPLVSGLFFLIVTLQKSRSLTLLRAIGAPSARLVTSLLGQVALVMAAGIALGTLLYAPLSVQRLGTIQLSFQTASVIGWAVLLFVLGLVSALVAARRVLRIDPVAATSNAGVGS
jgi:putative ABC transport system permease protein